MRRSGTVVLSPPPGTQLARCPVLAGGDEACPCAAGEGLLGRCYGTWQCQDGAGSRNLSAMSLAECCRHPWGHSWRNGSTAPCLACTHLPLAGGSRGPRGAWGVPQGRLLSGVTSPWQERRPPSRRLPCPCEERLPGTGAPRPAASPGPDPGTAPLTGGTSTSPASAPTAWPPPLTAPGPSPSLLAIPGYWLHPRWGGFVGERRGSLARVSAPPHGQSLWGQGGLSVCPHGMSHPCGVPQRGHGIPGHPWLPAATGVLVALAHTAGSWTQPWLIPRCRRRCT